MSSSTYQLVKYIKIPYKACYNSGNEYCKPCNNWEGPDWDHKYKFNYKTRGQCKDGDGFVNYTLTTDDDFNIVKSNINYIAIIENNGKFYCDVDNEDKCVGNKITDKKLFWMWDNLYHATSFKDDQLLHDSSAKTIYIKTDDTAHSLNTAQNMFTGTCQGNLGVNTITTKTLLENRFGVDKQWYDDDRKWLRYKNFDLPTPTHITYSNAYTCQSLPEMSTTLQTKEYDMDDISIETPEGIDFDTNGIIDSITYDTSKNKMIVKYFTDSNYNIISKLGVQVNVPIKSTYTIIAKDHVMKPVASSFSLINLKDKINSADNHYDLNEINTSLLQFSSNSYDLKGGTLTLKCPPKQYISGYSMKKDNDKNNIIVVPHCVQFEKKDTIDDGNGSGSGGKGGGSGKGDKKGEESSSNTTMWIIIAIVAVIIMIMLIVVLKSGNKTPDMAQLAAMMD